MLLTSSQLANCSLEHNNETRALITDRNRHQEAKVDGSSIDGTSDDEMTIVRLKPNRPSHKFRLIKPILNKPSSASSLSWWLLALVASIGTLGDLPVSEQQFIIKNNHVASGRYQHQHQQHLHPSSSSNGQQQHSLAHQLFGTTTTVGDQSGVPFAASSSVSRRSQPQTSINHHPSSAISYNDLEARGLRSINSYSQSSLLRGARNATFGSSGGSSMGQLGSWHFPRISPEQAAEVLLTGAQVINRIAQADTPLNYCKTPDNQDGECSDIRKCIWLVLDKARLKQSVCLRNLIIPAVCCPLSTANNTPIANMIQSTLEPVLFRPKPPKQKKHPTNHMKTFSSIVNKTIVGSPPPSPASLIIRNPHLNSTNGITSSGIDLSSQANKLIEYNVQSSSSSPIAEVSSSATPFSPVPIVSTSTSATTTTTTSTTTPFSIFQDENKDPATHGSHHPTPAHTYNRTVSQKYPWANETCGEGSRTRTGRIVGGSDSKLGQWPWMTAMYLNKRSPFSAGGGEFWCGGALINRRFILTAAHCLSDQRGNRYKNDQVTIKLGGVDLVRHQAPLDILRNGELEARGSQSVAVHDGSHRRHQVVSSMKARGSNDDEEEEFSWTSFITKALGLGGGGGSSSSSSSSSSSLSSSSSSSSSSSNGGGGGSNSGAPSGGSSGEGSTKSLNGATDKKQQLAAHAKRTYFKEYRVASIKQHPKFQRHGFYNDIGLIELKSDVDYDDLISPVCLPTEYDLKRDMSGYLATVLGWGTLSYGGQGSKLLQQVSMPIWNNNDCDDRYLQHIGKTFLCAGFLTGGKDACQGDSGGPLMVSDKSGRWTLHGVVSFGKTCAQAGYPGVYTRVTEYLDWIRDNTDLNGYTSAASAATNGR